MGYSLTNIAEIVTIYVLNSFIVLIHPYYSMYNSLCYYFHKTICEIRLHNFLEVKRHAAKKHCLR